MQRRLTAARRRDAPGRHCLAAQTKDPSWTWYATGPGHGIQLASGRLVVPCDHIVGRDLKAFGNLDRRRRLDLEQHHLGRRFRGMCSIIDGR